MPPLSKIPLCSCCGHAFERSSFLPSDPRSAALQQILKTLPPQDVSNISAILTAEIARYESEMDAISILFDPLYEDQVALQRLLAECIPVVHPPIRRLPNEILVQVFKFCEEPSEWSEDLVPAHCWDLAANEAVGRLAGGHLAAFSQVCADWRQVVLHTPTLWSRVTLDLRCWMYSIESIRTSRAFQWIVPLLEVALARGKQVPLSVDVDAFGACHPLALQTLATSAPRWRSASFTVESDLLTNLSGVAGNLPLLETLWMNVLNESPETLADLAQLFSSAPRLHTVEFCGPLSAVIDWPVEQFRSCTFGTLGPEDIRSLVAFIGRLDKAELHLQLNFEALQDSDVGSLDLVSVVSSIVELDISAMEHMPHQAQVTQRVLGEIFDALTLPSMERLHLCGATKSRTPVWWPHGEGMGLLRRCGSRTTLTSLNLDDVIIPESELLECLAALPQLQYLLISDHPGLDGLPENPIHHLINDSLLKKLTPSPCPDSPTGCLVPNLLIVDFKTLGKFTETVFIDFAEQRTMLARANDTFECALRWIPGWTCKLSPATVEVLNGWMKGGKMIVSWREYDLNDDE
ncbi:hypothetical protein C8R45DRAFT_1136209 [Mycena sanguinolenta]|nr:hypothetical protein C8R45DRAFT_1136209 [Mycena sanguinolenta]